MNTRCAALGLGVIVLFAGLASSNEPGATVSVQRIDVQSLPLVELTLTVTDPAGRSILGLSDREIEVSVDGRPQPILSLKSALEEGRSLAVVLVFDRSGSMRESMEEAKRAGVDFVRRLSVADEAAVISFDDVAALESGFSTDRDATASAIDKIALGKDTALYDATDLALDVLGQAQSSRQAVVLLSDGKDNRSRRTKDDVLAAAGERAVPVFAIGLGGDIDKAALEELVGRTGGAFFEAATAQALVALYQGIAERLNNQYILTFNLEPGRDEKWHALRVVLKEPGGATAETGREFIASTGPGVSRGVMQRLERAAESEDILKHVFIGILAGMGLGFLLVLIIGGVRGWGSLSRRAALLLFLCCLLLGATLGVLAWAWL